ncbi:EXS family-domain-containing protein [Phakopsora pachyrhizi]|uniref:EXS family-domain-containing protein n=1 Tax=Phakopsora pachyrhizi TaxID=170000 RepID=A0AAV0BU99_PHAPC|nr:EXS family-domain-containing protein [Phakopsora pachyrhizi]
MISLSFESRESLNYQSNLITRVSSDQIRQILLLSFLMMAGISDSFESYLPLQFRTLSIVSFSIICWAIDLQLVLRLSLDPTCSLVISQNSTNRDSTNLSSSLQNHQQVTPTSSPPIDPLKLNHPTGSHLSVYLSGLSLSIVTLVGLLISRVLSQLMIFPIGLSHWISFLPGLLMLIYPLRYAPFYSQFRSSNRRFFSSISSIISPSFGQSLTSFKELILADVLTSLAKLIGDVWLMISRIFENGDDGQNQSSMIISKFLVCLPFLIRFKQCVNDSIVGSEKRRSILNSIKYLSSLPPIFLLSNLQNSQTIFRSNHLSQTVSSSQTSDLTKLVDNLSNDTHHHLSSYILFSTINSLFSFYWDIVNDWGFFRSKRDTRNLKRKSLIFNGSCSNNFLKSNFEVLLSRRSGCKSSLGEDGVEQEGCEEQEANKEQEQAEASQSGGEGEGLVGGSRLKQSTRINLKRSRRRRIDSYYLVLSLMNLILRFAWILNVYSSRLSLGEKRILSRDERVDNLNYQIGYLLEFLEVFRRFVWCLIRIEWQENCRMSLHSSNNSRSGSKNKRYYEEQEHEQDQEASLRRQVVDDHEEDSLIEVSISHNNLKHHRAQHSSRRSTPTSFKEEHLPTHDHNSSTVQDDRSNNQKKFLINEDVDDDGYLTDRLSESVWTNNFEGSDLELMGNNDLVDFRQKSYF